MDCREIGAKTKLLGVLGEKISYSLSPRIHNFSFSKMGVNAIYVVFDVPSSRFDKTIKGLLELTYGINVTIPYKERVISHLDDLTSEAERIGAVNTVHERRGYNTDYLAIKSLVSSKFNSGGSALILGAGGASRAAAFALGDLGYKILIVNRTRERGEELVSKLSEHGINARFTTGCNADYEILVNTIPDPSAVPMDCVKGKLVVEFVYDKESPFLRRARELGMKVIDGLEILVRQAMEAEKIWFGKSLEDSEVVRTIAG
ncbi:MULTISPECIES: shikimate dehydrogenase family protein [Metallosphaera]|uniref:shikimate dehydrogenase family protein n=1 Tax=Metallosphaera TaxID=41980 RepID=UPI00064FC5ED